MIVKRVPKRAILLSTAMLDVIAADGHRHSLRTQLLYGLLAVGWLGMAGCTVAV
jgi:hypothetical protein